MLTPAVEAYLTPPASVGVIGGGQLGRMFVQAAQRMGYRAGVLANRDDEPAVQVADWAVVAPFDQITALREFAQKAEAVTVEFENVSAPAMRWLARSKIVRPGWRTVWTSQNRLREKTFLTRHGIPHAPWHAIHSSADVQSAVRKLGTPLILKTASSGYDGKGQVLVTEAGQAQPAWESLGQVSAVAEGWVEFQSEISVIVARGADGTATTFPVGLNRHRNHILDSTIMPAPVGPAVSQDARTIALSVAQALGTVGVLTVEFFVTANGGLLVNELAPRPHNSGHLTIEACVSSQFEQQVRTLCGLPLGSTELLAPAAMVNLLGDWWEGGEPNWKRMLEADPGVKLHLYGKGAASIGRKMGHLTVLDTDMESALNRARAARATLGR